MMMTSMNNKRHDRGACLVAFVVQLLHVVLAMMISSTTVHAFQYPQLLKPRDSIFYYPRITGGSTTSTSSNTRLCNSGNGGSSGGNDDEQQFFNFMEKLVEKGMAQVEVDGQPWVAGGGGSGGGNWGDDNTNDSSDSGGGETTTNKQNDDAFKSLLSFDWKPKEIVEYLDRFVIQQNDAKQVLAVAICDHYNHCRRCLQEEEEKARHKKSQKNSEDDDDDYYEIEQLLEAMKEDDDSKSAASSNIEYAKPNVLLAGPTGVGKTYLLKCLARLVGVPFVKADATKFSETGIVGRDAEDLVRDLVDKANGNTTLASMGIIYLDEVDKIAAGAGNGGRDGSVTANTRGVQNNFLKLLEDTDVSLERQTDMIITGLPSFMGGSGDNDKPKTISTKNILFIFSGAFTSLDKELKQKREKKAFGLDITGGQSTAGKSSPPRQPPSPASSPQDGNNKPRSYLRFAETSDFVRIGLEPEFVGRVPVRVALDALDASDLKQILVGAEGSVWKQFKCDMDGYGIKMTATDDALEEVAKLAEKEMTGARGLVTILERTLRRHKYELPSTSIDKFVLTKATVLNPELELARLLASQTTDDDMEVLMRDLTRWENKINRQLPWPAKVRLTDDAVKYLVLKSLEKETSAYSFASRHFGGDNGGPLPAVVQRINEATSQTEFPITIEMAKHPKKELRKWLDMIKKTVPPQDDDDDNDNDTITNGNNNNFFEDAEIIIDDNDEEMIKRGKKKKKNLD